MREVHPNFDFHPNPIQGSYQLHFFSGRLLSPLSSCSITGCEQGWGTPQVLGFAIGWLRSDWMNRWLPGIEFFNDLAQHHPNCDVAMSEVEKYGNEVMMHELTFQERDGTHAHSFPAVRVHPHIQLLLRMQDEINSLTISSHSPNGRLISTVQGDCQWLFINGRNSNGSQWVHTLQGICNSVQVIFRSTNHSPYSTDNLRAV